MDNETLNVLEVRLAPFDNLYILTMERRLSEGELAELKQRGLPLMPYKDPLVNLQKCRERRQTNLTTYRQKEREFRQRNREQLLEVARQWRKNNPEKAYAGDRIRKAVRAGYIIRPEGKVFHHPDYSRVYYGVWITQAEHQMIHNGLMDCPPCTDYTDIVLRSIKNAKHEASIRGAKRTCEIRWGKR